LNTFSARDADEREKWIHALEDTILRHTLQLQASFTFTFNLFYFLFFKAMKYNGTTANIKHVSYNIWVFYGLYSMTSV